MNFVRTLLICGLISTGAAALACGPEFPWSLLDKRETTLKNLPTNSFFFMASHLLPVSDPKLKEPPTPPPWESRQPPSSCLALDAATQASEDSAAERSPAVSRLFEDYARGVQDFNARSFDQASHAFRDALASGTEDARVVCAAYMLGRSLTRTCGDSH